MFGTSLEDGRWFMETALSTFSWFFELFCASRYEREVKPFYWCAKYVQSSKVSLWVSSITLETIVPKIFPNTCCLHSTHTAFVFGAPCSLSNAITVLVVVYGHRKWHVFYVIVLLAVSNLFFKVFVKQVSNFRDFASRSACFSVSMHCSDCQCTKWIVSEIGCCLTEFMFRTVCTRVCVRPRSVAIFARFPDCFSRIDVL